VSAAGATYGVEVNGQSQEVFSDALGATTDQRPVWCDVDGDGTNELVLGFGPGSNSQILVVYWNAGSVTGTQVVQGGWPQYDALNGETFPACGDLDGDGRDEIVVGLGDQGQGYMQVLDDRQAGFAPMANSPEPEGWIILPEARAAHPAVGDVDFDGKAEIVVGFDGIGDSIWVFDDASRRFAPLRGSRADSDGRVVLSGWSSHVDAGSSTRPAVGDVDGDGYDEIAVGFGPGGRGYVLMLDDAAHAFGVYEWVLSGNPSYNSQNGETVPSVGDMDQDGRAEVAVGLGTGGGGQVQILDDAAHGFSPHPGTSLPGGWIDLNLATTYGPLRPAVPAELLAQPSAQGVNLANCPEASSLNLSGRLGERLRSCLCAREMSASGAPPTTVDRLFSATACSVGALALDLVGP
jgi:hypothetical protein